jgi:hypothetical protein
VHLVGFYLLLSSCTHISLHYTTIYVLVLFVSPSVNSINRSGNQMYLIYITNNDVTGFTLQRTNTVSDYKSKTNSEIYGGISISWFSFYISCSLWIKHQINTQFITAACLVKCSVSYTGRKWRKLSMSPTGIFNSLWPSVTILKNDKAKLKAALRKYLHI